MMSGLKGTRISGIAFKKSGLLLVFLVIVATNSGITWSVAFSVQNSTPVIALEEFRWTSFPLNVYVDLNSWSLPSYAVAVREALDSWVKSIWNYTQTYNDTSLPTVSYTYYVSHVNATDHYDVIISFTPENMPPSSNTVGLTTYSWNAITHTPLTPITINITTSSGTATNLFVKNVAMHEFGHALGLGHATSAETLNGPELMYFTSSKNEVVYPSTLDMYALASLYHGRFSQDVQLPDYIPYVMLSEGVIPPPQTINLLDAYKPFLPVIGVIALLVATAVVLGYLSKGGKDQNVPQPPPPPTVDIPRYVDNSVTYIRRKWRIASNIRAFDRRISAGIIFAQN